MKGITAEQERILIAAREERLRVNIANSRWEIEGGARPDRRERERLQNRDLLPRYRGNPVRITERGIEALETAPRLASSPPAAPTLMEGGRS